MLAHTLRFRRLSEAARERIAETGGTEHGEFWATVEGENSPPADG